MSFDEKRLYELLPAIYRIRDAEQGEPLRALLKVVAEQVGVLEENLSQLYDDQFAETCAPWVLPYIGDLIGITGLGGANLPTLSPRAEVGHTISYRRGKGTAAMLEQLARDVSGWPARAVEFFQLIATTQYMNHLRPENQSFINVRGAERLEYVGSAFEHATTGGAADLTHTVDVRRIASGHGRYNIPNVGIFLWRLRSFSLTRSPAVPASPGDQRRFFLSPLGIDLPLFNLPLTEEEPTHLAEPVNVPDRIKRRALDSGLTDYYGRGKSLRIELGDADIRVEPTEIPSEDIVVCDLTDWENLPSDKVAVDPVLGRVAFPQAQQRDVLATFHYGFSANMGGGEYNRLTSFDTRAIEVLDDSGHAVVNKVANTYFKDAAEHNVKFGTINDALALLGPDGGAVEVVNSGRYEESLTIDATGKRIELRAADKRRPTIVLGADLQISGGANDEVILDGLLITGGTLKVSGQLGRLRLRHCTLVPGISLNADGTPSKPRTPSLVVKSENTRVEIDHCITGGILAAGDVEVQVSDSIIDSTDEENTAYAGTDWYGGPLRITNSTVIGMTRTSIMRLASNTIFLAAIGSEYDKGKLIAPVLAERRQEGCVRFSYLSPGARVPSRYHCQPESDASLIRPRLMSRRFKDPEYCQLSAFCVPEIRRGADDEAGMGAFHDLFEPQREAHLRTRIDEYLRFGLEAGLFYAT
ncbi:MAG TPA: hypothetical protein VGX92_14065 [Pyrinomonadaceae bacterium]|nr:hypothetical protein [Pyrinomonadaceae bacterium]